RDLLRRPAESRRHLAHNLALELLLRTRYVDARPQPLEMRPLVRRALQLRRQLPPTPTRHPTNRRRAADESQLFRRRIAATQPVTLRLTASAESHGMKSIHQPPPHSVAPPSRR